jgi:hypothetical protein
MSAGWKISESSNNYLTIDLSEKEYPEKIIKKTVRWIKS